MSEKQFYLLQVNDALFPIGGYSHSQGLETYIQRGIVHDADTAREYITHKIKWNLAYTELLGARLAYEAARENDLSELLELEEILEASRIPWSKERRKKDGLPFCQNHRKAGTFHQRNGNFPGISGREKGKSGESLLHLRRFLCPDGDFHWGGSGPLSVCTDLCNGN